MHRYTKHDAVNMQLAMMGRGRFVLFVFCRAWLQGTESFVLCTPCLESLGREFPLGVSVSFFLGDLFSSVPGRGKQINYFELC